METDLSIVKLKKATEAKCLFKAKKECLTLNAFFSTNWIFVEKSQKTRLGPNSQFLFFTTNGQYEPSAIKLNWVLMQNALKRWYDQSLYKQEKSNHSVGMQVVYCFCYSSLPKTSPMVFPLTRGIQPYILVTILEVENRNYKWFLIEFVLHKLLLKLSFSQGFFDSSTSKSHSCMNFWGRKIW